MREATGRSRWAAAGSALRMRADFPLAGAGTDPTPVRALEHLRGRTLPAMLGVALPDMDYAVAGKTATPHDLARQVSSRTPLDSACVLVPAFVLLVVAFRSLAVPLVSIALDLLSIGAACGVPARIFQGATWGRCPASPRPGKW
ncbi:MMPL family transporter [Streptomyces enissocaesilis]|uniref:Membrane transport protein MMPL domain-containing protein n=1 Tax=Streptomyces enissocaesilis TaxID=332589 RepID=A0ABP6JLJ8_9ACTN